MQRVCVETLLRYLYRPVVMLAADMNSIVTNDLPVDSFIDIFPKHVQFNSKSRFKQRSIVLSSQV